MKEVRAYVESERLETIAEALEKLGVSGFTAINVVGRGRKLEADRGRKVRIGSMELLSCMKIEVICDDTRLEPVIAAIQEAAWTGDECHGEIFVSPIERHIRINPLDQGLNER